MPSTAPTGQRSGEAPATEEIEITPEMIAAGADVIFECFGESVGWRSSYCPYVANAPEFR